MDFLTILSLSENSPKNSQLTLKERVEGLEHEYAIEFREIDNYDQRDEYIAEKVREIQGINAFGVNGDSAVHTFNGGKVYIDLEHLEGCTPEVRNTEELITYDRALDLQILDLFGKDYGPRIYRMSRDSKNTFGGMHRNIMTKLSTTIEDREQLLLWAVVEKVMTGGGYQHSNGAYEILQRRIFIKEALSDTTMDQYLDDQERIIQKGRPLLNLRPERLCNIPGWYRFHDIASDASMDQSTLALGQELWKCVLQLAENKLLPHIPYYTGLEAKNAVADMNQVCKRHSNWTLEGTPPEFRSVVSVLKEYYEVIKGELYGEDTFRNRVIDMFGETVPLLGNIEKYPYALAGRISWITKKYLLERFMGYTGFGPDHCEVQDNNLDYHRIDPEGLFYQASADGWIETWITDREARKVINTPPRTRAYARGMIAQLFSQLSGNQNLSLTADWEEINVVNEALLPVWSRKFSDPRLIYDKDVESFKQFLRNHGGKILS